MRAWLAIATGIALGVGAAWWLARESPDATTQKQARADQAAAAQARDARPSLYRWRDDAGVLQITEQPPKDRRYERIDRDAPPGIRVSGDAAATDAD
ncbi:DUF4124 domain-containing protein [Pseudoxanthomonas sp. PXM02]|uniref:DUF4124 domain-containing protein n=1 Tax=Pseudoxanthomonas sp. PXM02 TaxID=2769294 RepID=UPI001785DDBB|nr:DUF4124 domain-containing protein [Pseudoxanthomonas sp. PXM02]MBD9479368.1 DUF4124 domain-containing protein [Pseudoxanthomonas sp. PXM02]